MHFVERNGSGVRGLEECRESIGIDDGQAVFEQTRAEAATLESRCDGEPGQVPVR
jgi:hypothetical protein